MRSNFQIAVGCAALWSASDRTTLPLLCRSRCVNGELPHDTNGRRYPGDDRHHGLHSTRFFALLHHVAHPPRLSNRDEVREELKSRNFNFDVYLRMYADICDRVREIID